jgi:Protein of unknown function (DUF3631)
MLDGDATQAGDAALSDIKEFVQRFVSYPSIHAAIAHTLWIGHTHLMEVWDSTPRIAFLSKEPGSGKTRALEVTRPLVPRPVESVNVTSAYLFRKVGSDEGKPTILYDEIDTVFGPKAKDNEDLRGLLNAGHRRGATAGRCVMKGKAIETEELEAYCAVAFAGLGHLPDTLMSRSIPIRMRRRAPGEEVQPFRPREQKERAADLHRRLATWATGVAPTLHGKWPDMPPGVEDRAADVWEPLLAVADAAGGIWPTRAREAAIALVNAARQINPSSGVRLLEDVRKVFGQRDAMFTSDLLAGLFALPESRWMAADRGAPLTAVGLSTRLDGYGIRPAQVRLVPGGDQHRGYRKAWFQDAWLRYLTPSTRLNPITPVTPVTLGLKPGICAGVPRDGCDA